MSYFGNHLGKYSGTWFGTLLGAIQEIARGVTRKSMNAIFSIKKYYDQVF